MWRLSLWREVGLRIDLSGSGREGGEREGGLEEGEGEEGEEGEGSGGLEEKRTSGVGRCCRRRRGWGRDAVVIVGVDPWGRKRRGEE